MDGGRESAPRSTMETNHSALVQRAADVAVQPEWDLLVNDVQNVIVNVLLHEARKGDGTSSNAVLASIALTNLRMTCQQENSRRTVMPSPAPLQLQLFTSLAEGKVALFIDLVNRAKKDPELKAFINDGFFWYLVGYASASLPTLAAMEKHCQAIMKGLGPGDKTTRDVATRYERILRGREAAFMRANRMDALSRPIDIERLFIAAMKEGRPWTLSQFKSETDVINKYLSKAAASGRLELVKEMIESVRVVDQLDLTLAFQAALYEGHLSVVEYLAERLSYDDWQTRREFMRDAITHGHLAIVRLLNAKGVSLDELEAAAVSRQLHIIRFILEQLPNATPIQNATRIKDPEILTYLDQNGKIQLDETTIDYIFDDACENGNMKLTDFLISRGAVPNGRNMMQAIERGHLALVKRFADQHGLVPDKKSLAAAMKSPSLAVMEYVLGVVQPTTDELEHATMNYYEYPLHAWICLRDQYHIPVDDWHVSRAVAKQQQVARDKVRDIIHKRARLLLYV